MTSLNIQTIETDVVVLGFGAAGAVAAINAHDAGAGVIILEKMATPGGSSILAGGAMKAVHDVGKAVAYLTATQGGRVKDKLIHAFAQGLFELPGYLQELAAVNGAKVAIRDNGNNGLYDLPGAETFFSAVIQDVPGFAGYPWLQRDKLNGPKLIKLLEDNVTSRKIPVHYGTSAISLVTNEFGEITGVRAVSGGSKILVKAKRGVILATGGFEFNEKLKKEYLEAIPVYSMGNPGNTGDGILMAQKVGAALWHMWHIHGSYGFKFPEIDAGIRTRLGGARNPNNKVPWILLDQNGRRFMNEYQPAPQDTMHRPLQHLDPELPGFTRIPAYLIFDEEGRKTGPIGNPITAHEPHRYDWSRDNSAEVERGWIKKADTVEELARQLGLPADVVTASVDRWNKLVDDNHDADFGRPAGTVLPIAHGPFYGVPVWPICTNTQGGPEHDEKQRVLDPYGTVIPRLYAVGELGSFFGHIYLLGGNLSECIISGRIAGAGAAGEPPVA